MENEKLNVKDFYKEKIIEIVEKTERLDVLEYLYQFMKEKIKVGS